MRQNLLIVDDEPSNLQKLQRTFVGEFQIYEANSGEEALGVLKKSMVDVIITDQRMRGMTGVDLLSQSLNWRPDALRIILTGYTEVEYLMDAINQGQVHRYITKPWDPFALRQTVLQDLEHARLKRENRLLEEQLRIAKEVQEYLLPRRIPQFQRLEIAAICRPAGQVGGDYYDFLQLTDKQFWFAVGDISGKGISAALLMASLQALLRSHGPRQQHALGPLLGEINQLLGSITEDNRFATLFCGVIDEEHQQLTYANAGHHPALLFSEASAPTGGEAFDGMHRLKATGVPLGLFPSAGYEQITLPFTAGDRLVIYTDGIVEATDAQDREFGEEGIVDLARQRAHSPRELQDEILRRVSEHCGGGPMADDLTLVVIKQH